MAAAKSKEHEAAGDSRGLIVGSTRYMYMAEAEAENTKGQFYVLNDLSEHYWADRCALIAPYVPLSLNRA